MKKAYVTILSSDGFVKGVIALHKGLKRYSREEFAVFTGPEVSEPVKEELRRNNINIIEVDEPSIDLSGVNDVQLRDRWIKTLFKLVVFKDYGYEKLVYLDSDLLIRGNLDELFDKPAISAVSDRAFFPQFSRGGLNAGVMVIEPDEKLYEALCKEIPTVAAKGTALPVPDRPSSSRRAIPITRVPSSPSRRTTTGNRRRVSIPAGMTGEPVRW